MHKGFAFIQFTNPFDARSACLGEDGRTVLGQTLGKSLRNTSNPIVYTALPTESNILIRENYDVFLKTNLAAYY